jgi:predicted HTH transcriptional regulator
LARRQLCDHFATRKRVCATADMSVSAGRASCADSCWRAPERISAVTSNPIQFPRPEREAPFDVAPIRKIISDLMVRPTDEVESEELEIKGWCKNERELADKVSEACSCLANTSGGYVLVGVAEGVVAGRKFSACPHPRVTLSWLQTNVHNLTRPPVEITPFDASPLLAEMLASTGNNLYVLRVHRTRCISGHVTNKGVSKVRVGKECQPQFIAEDDRTNTTVPGVSLEDLSESSIDWGIAQHRRHFKTSSTWESRQEFLEQGRLIQTYLPDEDYLPSTQISFAALLLFGKASTLEQRVPFFETIILADKEPLRIRKNVVDSVRDLCTGEGSLLRNHLPRIPEQVLRELIANAYIHRCYRTPGPVVVNISEMEGLEIKSPGALLTGLNVNNLIYGVPVYRNLLLADGARFVGLCDKIGRGIDLIFEGVLSEGLGFPEFESGDNVFSARIPLSDSAEFRQFLRKRSQALSNLDEIIVLRLLWGKNYATLDDLCCGMQRKMEFGERVLREMCRKNMVEPVDQFYRLTAVVRRDIETVFQSDQLSLDPSLWS